MKKTLLLMCFLTSFTLLNAQENSDVRKSTDRAEETYYHLKGSHSFNLGVGFPNLANTAFRAGQRAGFENEGGASPNFTLKYEYGISDVIGIGAHVGYYTAKTPTYVTDIVTGDILDVLGGFGCDLGIALPGVECDTVYATEDGEPSYDRIHATTLGGRFAYRKASFFGIEKLDAYGTVMLGFSFFKTKRIGSESENINESNLPNFIYNTSAGLRYFIKPNVGIYGELGYGSLTVLNLGLTYRIMPKRI